MSIKLHRVKRGIINHPSLNSKNIIIKAISLTLPHNGHTFRSASEAELPAPMIQGRQLPQQTVSAIRQARDTYGPALRSDR